MYIQVYPLEACIGGRDKREGTGGALFFTRIGSLCEVLQADWTSTYPAYGEQGGGSLLRSTY